MVPLKKIQLQQYMQKHTIIFFCNIILCTFLNCKITFCHFVPWEIPEKILNHLYLSEKWALFFLNIHILVRMLREELQLLQEQGSYVGEVVKPMDKKKVLVKVSVFEWNVRMIC